MKSINRIIHLPQKRTSGLRKSFIHLWAICTFFLCTSISALAQTMTPAPAGTGSTAISIGGGCFNMTPQSGGGCSGVDMRGAIWASPKLDFTHPFVISFTANFDTWHSVGADGIVVAFGDNLTTSTGPNAGAGEIGYYGAAPPFASHSFGIEFDTYDNGPTASDISDNHVAVNRNGSHASVIVPAASINGPAGIKDAIDHPIKITWDPNGPVLRVFWDGICKKIVESYYDYRSEFINPANVGWGVTAGTGGACSNQKVCNFSTFIPSTDEYDTACYPGPVTLVAPTGYSSYSWTTGAISSSINVSATGTYTVTCFKDCNVVQKVFHVTINPLPTFVGSTTVCVGGTTTLSSPMGGGTWSSSNPLVGTVNATTGAVTGISTGTTTITLKLSSTGCQNTINVTVNTIDPPTGVLTVCVGSTTTLFGSGGGTWSSSNPAVGTVGLSTGVVTGISAGTTKITFTQSPSGCKASTIVTVLPSPSPITGVSTMCVGTGGFESDATLGGTWSCSPTSICVINTIGGVVGVAPGTAYITYTGSNGCIITKIVTVNITPKEINGNPETCIGYTTTLTDSIAGGTWSSSNTSIATVGSSTGIVTGVATGTCLISYTLPNGCLKFIMVTIYGAPSAISGPSEFCAGIPQFFSCSPSGGTWSASPSTVVTIATDGTATGVGGGTGTISYTLHGCTPTKAVTVDPSPLPISGTVNLCIGTTATVSDATSGGVWSVVPAGIVSISGSGLVTGLAAGTATIYYTTSAHGCYAATIATVNPAPKPLNGPSTVCSGSSITLTDSVGGGTWSSSDYGIGFVVSYEGVVYGGGTGTAIITYTTMCGMVTKMITVNPNPAPIVGPPFYCQGGTYTLTDPTPGGVWSTRFAIVVTNIGPLTGILNCVQYGPDTVYYTLPTGCKVMLPITISMAPSAIAGDLEICAGSTDTLTNMLTGGSWSSSDTSVATIFSTPPMLVWGIVHGLTAGTTIISYYLDHPECAATAVLTVDPLPGPIIGNLHVCPGGTTVLHDTVVGGTWHSSNSLVADVDASGTVSGHVAGTAVISYTIGGSCITSVIITVDPLPALITGTFSTCQGSTTTLSDATPGGTWSSSTSAVGTVGLTSGVVNGILAGTTTITYTASTGCYRTVTFTVNPLPATIGGTLSVCKGQTTALIDVTTGGTWSSGSTGIATIGSSSGIVTGVSPGTAVITYKLSTTGCYATAVMTVLALPAPITILPGAVCAGDTATAYDVTSGGTWSSSNSAVAPISPTTGHISSGVSGTATITYKLTATGCYVTTVFTVNPLPDPIGGNGFVVCQGQTIHIYEATDAGTWSSSTPTVGTIDGFGNVTGISGGTTTITYMVGTGCYVTQVVTVNPLPVVGLITAADPLCVGGSSAISDPTAGGTWNVSDPSVLGLSFVVGGGLTISGLTVGTSLLSYTVVNGCGPTTVTKLIHVINAPVVAPITGILGVCSGYTDTLYNAVPGGTWSSSNTTLATIDSVTGVVTGLATGSMTITYRVTNICGTDFTTVNVLVNMEPYITSNYLVACQIIKDTLNNTHLHQISGTACILVCDSSVVRYYANGVSGSHFTWLITGGTVVTDYGDSIDVFWPTTGITGSVLLQDSFSHCIDSARACIKVISKPQANFWMVSSHYCKGDNIVFYDLSTGDPSSPIANYHWDFGDGTGASTAGTVEHSYSVAGTYNVVLVVRNQCNCLDSFVFKVKIDKTPGPDIQCPAIVCQNENVIYKTSAPCSSFVWTVSGGTIISGAGTAAITVRWDAVDSTGFGYVSLYTPGCAICSDPTTIKVPVIMQNPSITGPDVICLGKQYTYSLPLWAATDYRWGVLGEPWTKVGCLTDNKIVVQFTTPGTKTIHGWYQNRLKGCGAEADKVITVVPATAIVGNTRVCADPAVVQTYSVAGGYIADWKLETYTGTLISSASGGMFNYAFSTPGTYLLIGEGAFCADSLTINVVPLPGTIDSVTGANTVCLNRVYSYTAWNDAPGNIYQWEAVGGTVSPASGSSAVNVIWSSYGTKQLKVRHVSVTAPYCEGPQTIIDISTENINPHILGNLMPCANSYKFDTCTYTRGENYDWLILPDSVGSVVSGNHTAIVKLLWNNVAAPTTARVVVKVSKCDTVVTDTMTVTVQPSTTIVLTGPSGPQCPSTLVSFAATDGGASYVWDFGDGSPLVTTPPYSSPDHAYPPNPTTGNMNYLVKVHVLPDPAAECPVAGNANFNMVIKPGPVAYASTAQHEVCFPSTRLVTGTVTSNAGALTYQWYNGSTIGGATGDTLMITGPGTYFFQVTAANGCSSTSNIVPVTWRCDTISDSACTFQPRAASSASCNTITLQVISGPAGISMISWHPDVLPLGWTDEYLAGNPITVSYGEPGIYGFGYWADSNHCYRDGSIIDTIGIIPDYVYTMKCGAGMLDTLHLTDHSAYLPWWSIDSVRWAVDGVYQATGSGYNAVLVAGTTHTITETVFGTKPGGTYSCPRDHILMIPPRPNASFTFATSPICENVPINFTSISGFLDYKWDFGDTSGILLPNPQRTYTHKGSAVPQIIPVTLTITDTLGCTADTTREVKIYPNTLHADMDLGGTVCPDAIPYYVNVLVFGGTMPLSYLWSMDSSTLVPTKAVYETGSYWVTVTDAYQCQLTAPIAENVNVMHLPHASIMGVRHYCIGDAVRLFGYSGTGVSYQWFRNDTLISLNPAIVDSGLGVGTYPYKLVLTVLDTATGTGCTDTSDVVTISIYGLPAKPTITGPTLVDCADYHLQLTASEPVSGTYNWSDNTYGQVDDVYNGGPVRVWFTDLHGCISSRDVTVPADPAEYFAYFPSGCYTLCTERLPITLNGPPCVAFDSSVWLDGTSVVAGGLGGLVSYAINNNGQYRWVIKNGLCTKESDVMSVQTQNCTACQHVDLAASLTCDPAHPDHYQIAISFNTMGAGSTYALGTNYGPITPFSGIVPGTTFSSTLSFTFLPSYPLLDSVVVDLELTDPSGSKCFQKVTIPRPPCSWTVEKGSTLPANGDTSGHNLTVISSAMMVFPNPASGEVTVSYEYGSEGNQNRLLTVYDAMGRKMNAYQPQETRGAWKLNTVEWAAGMYIIRMEGDGKPLQTQRVIVVNH